MANTNRKKTKNDKLSTGKRKKTMRPEEVEELKFLSPDERIQYVIEHAHLIKDKLFNDVALRQGDLKKEALVKNTNKLASKNGILKKRSKHIKYLDSILMSELLIGQPPTREKTKPRDNNNDTDLSDQNNSDSPKNKPNKTKAANESEKNIITEDNNEVIQNAVDNNDPIVPAEQTIPDETKKAKRQPQKSKSNNKNSDVIDITIDANDSAAVDPTNSTNVAKKAKSKNKDTKILAQRLEQMKKVKLSNGFSLCLTYYQCDYCQRKFDKKFCLQRHILLHIDIKPFACSLCPKKYINHDTLRLHMARIHPEAYQKAKYHCTICKKPFMLLEQLKLHRKEHAEEKKRRYKCVFCEKVFKKKLQLAKHETYHMAPGRYKCATCSMSYESRALYSDHLKSHSLVQDFSCQFCGKSYQRPSSIARHIRVSHGGMRMQCPVCNKLLKGHLSEHMRTHENERPHECDVCGQRFTQSTQLTVHKRSHTGDRPYPCRICKQPFSHSNALMLHIRRHTGEKPFECAMCPQTFSQLPHMKAHMRSIHNKTEFYKCNNCNTFFKLKTLLEAHAEECGEAASVQKRDKADDTLVSRMRFLLALLFTMIASKEKLNDLGFNKRLIDDILVDSIEAMGLTPCKDASLAALPRLQSNALLLLRGTVPKHQMALFVKENKSTEEILGLLTDDVNKK